MSSLASLGWTPFFAEALSQLETPDQIDWLPARVSQSAYGLCRVMGEFGEVDVITAGRERPVVGDWVALELDESKCEGVIRLILPRRGGIQRQAVIGKKGGEDRMGPTQMIAANVDVALLVMGLDRDYNLRRIERYATLAYGCGVQPVIVLNKADLCPEAEIRKAEVEAVSPGTSVLCLSAKADEDLEKLRRYIPAGTTACLLGSSGAGKSTIINRLMGREKLKTAEVGEYAGKGRHTTTHRELLLLPGGGVVIDNPGVRELGLAGATEEGLEEAFSDVEALAKGCKFRDCGHENEPVCAVRKAQERGELPPGRLESYLKLKTELRVREDLAEKGSSVVEREKWKPIKKEIRRMKK